MEKRRIWAVRAGSFGQADHIFLGLNQIAISFAESGGDVSQLPAARSAFRDAVGASHAATAPTQANQLFRFLHEMRIGDYVIYPRKSDRTLHWGEVTGPYIFDRERSNEFAHRRGVEWLAKLSRDVFSQGALYEIGSILTLFEVKSFAAEFLRKFAAASQDSGLLPEEEDMEEAAARDVSETTRDFIAADVVKAFYAMVHERDVGVFITTGGFTQSALEFARTKGNIKLVDGVQFIDLIERHYDALDAKHRREIPLRRVLVPDLAFAED